MTIPPLTFLQCIEIDFDLIIEGVPVEELSSILIEPSPLFSCERVQYLKNLLITEKSGG